MDPAEPIKETPEETGPSSEGATTSVAAPAEKKESSGKWDVDGVVLAKCGPLIYQAKILKVREVKGETHYFVHYNNWNKKWDSWVREADVLEENETNIQLAAQLRIKVLEEKKKRGGRGRPRDEKDNEDDEDEKGDEEDEPKKKPKKEGGDPSIEDDSQAKAHNISLRIPGQLKKQLIVDWENVTKHKKILPLPRKAGTVAQILSDFLKTKAKNAEALEIFTEMCNGLQMYFDRALPFILLYTDERPQYRELCPTGSEKDIVPSELYGAEHLARLFVKLPELLSHTQMSVNELGLLQTKLLEFLKWFAKNPKFFGKPQYVETPEKSALAP